MPSYISKPPWSVPQIRRDHWLSKSIAFATLLNDPFEPMDLVTRKRGTLTSGVDPRVMTPYGRGLGFPGTSTDRVSFTGMAPPISGSGRCTVAVLANPLAEARTNCLLSQRNTGGTNQFSLYANTNTSFGTESGSLWFNQDDSVAIIHASRATNVITGAWSWYVITTGGGTASSNTRYYIDGNLQATFSNVNSGGAAGTDENFCLGAPTNYTGGGYTHNKEMAAAFVWNEREFTPAEVREFVKDPWVWLREAPIEVWPASTGGGTADGVLSSTSAGAASFTATAQARAALSGIGTSAGLFASAGAASSVFTSAAIGAASFTTSSLARSVLASSGVGALTGTAQATASGILNATGTSTLSAVSGGGGIFSATLTSTASSLFTGAAQAVAASVYASTGTSAAAMAGAAIARGAYASGGTATVTLISQTVGSSTFVAVGAGAAAFVATGGGSGAFSMAGLGLFSGVGRANALSAVTVNSISAAAWVAPFTGAGSILDGKRKLYVIPETRILKAMLK